MPRKDLRSQIVLTISDIQKTSTYLRLIKLLVRLLVKLLINKSMFFLFLSIESFKIVLSYRICPPICGFGGGPTLWWRIGAATRALPFSVHPQPWRNAEKNTTSFRSFHVLIVFLSPSFFRFLHVFHCFFFFVAQSKCVKSLSRDKQLRHFLLWRAWEVFEIFQ